MADLSVTLYTPGVGENDMMENILAMEALTLGLYKNVVVPDGNTTIDSLTEMPTGGGRGYAPIALDNKLVGAVAAADGWSIAQNAAGKAQAQYGLTAGPQAWTFLAPDVADANTVQGVFAYSWHLPFDAGQVIGGLLKVGDTIKGAAGATGVITAVVVTSGSFAAGTAAGYFCIKSKSATAFVNDEVLTKQGVVATVTIVAAGTGYAVGDILQITQTGGSGVKLAVSSVGASGEVTGVVVVEGGGGYSAAAGLPTTHLTGAGDDACTITIASLATTTYATSNTGTVNGGDALKRLRFVGSFSTGQAVTQLGQQITWLPLWTLSSAS